MIIDGELNAPLLKQIGKNKRWLHEILQSNNVRKYKDIFILSVTDRGEITLITQEETQEKGKGSLS